MKTAILLAAFLLGWGYCGYLAHGYFLGAFTQVYPDQCHEAQAFPSYIGGPIALAVDYTFVVGDAAEGTQQVGHPFLAKPYNYTQRFAEFNKRFAILGENYFRADSISEQCTDEEMQR